MTKAELLAERAERDRIIEAMAAELKAQPEASATPREGWEDRLIDRGLINWWQH